RVPNASRSTVATTSAMRHTRNKASSIGRSRRNLLEERGFGVEMMRRQEPFTHTTMRGRAHRLRVSRIVDQQRQRSRKRAQISGIVEQDAAHAVDDLILNAADTTRDDRPSLPHRLRDGEPKALDETLLRD